MENILFFLCTGGDIERVWSTFFLILPFKCENWESRCLIFAAYICGYWEQREKAYTMFGSRILEGKEKKMTFSHFPHQNGRNLVFLSLSTFVFSFSFPSTFSLQPNMKNYFPLYFLFFSLLNSLNQT